MVNMPLAMFGVQLPPRIAAILTWAFIAYLFRRDFQRKPHVTSALWLPFLWIFIIASRPVGQWFSLLGLPTGGGSLEEGSPLDAAVVFGLMAAGLLVLTRRQINLAEIVRNNVWLTVFVVYCFLSITWSDFPFVTFKRSIKLLGSPIMVLIILSEPNAKEALNTLLKRSAYVLVPLSILFIKYYVAWGRRYDSWTGAAQNTGVTTDKNMLGCGLLIFGLFFLWCFLQTLRSEKSRARRNELIFNLIFLGMILWLLRNAHSATSLVALILGVLVVVFLGRRFVNPRLIGTYVLAGILLVAVAELCFGLSSSIIELLGRNSTLSGRTEIWKAVLAVHINPIFGTGYQSFWLGDRLEELWSKYWFHPIEAHSGYVETYLSLGLLGLAILAGLLFATYCKIRRDLFDDFEVFRLRLGYLVAIVAYNGTEAAFQGMSFLFFVFWVIALDYPNRQIAPIEQSSEITGPEAEMELVYRGFGEG